MPLNKSLTKDRKDTKASTKPKDLRELIEERRNKNKRDNKKPVQKTEKKLELFTSHFKSDRSAPISTKKITSQNSGTSGDRWKKNADVEVDSRSRTKAINSNRELSPPRRDTRNARNTLDQYETPPSKDFRNSRNSRNRYEDSPIRETNNSRYVQDTYVRSPSRNSRNQSDRGGPTSVLIGNIANYLSSAAVSNWLSQQHPVNEVKLLYYKDKDQNLKQSRFAEAIFATEKGAQASVELLNNFSAENGTVSMEIVENGISKK